MPVSITLKIEQLLELIHQLGYEEKIRIIEELTEERKQAERADLDAKINEFFLNVEKLKCHLPEGYKFDRDEIHER